MKRILTVLLLVVVAVLASCTQGKKRAKGDVKGTWTLVRMAYPGDELVREYPSEDISWLRIYDDSCYYECEVVNASTGTMFIPSKTGTYNLIETGKDQFLYMQEDGRHPFVIEDDSTIMIQVAGIKYTWKICDDYDEDKTGAIISIIKNDVEDGSEAARRYVFSYAEKHLQTVNHVFIYSSIFVAFVVFLIVSRYYNLYKSKKRIEQELRQIEQEHRSIPQPVREAMNSVEDQFRESAFYVRIRQKITNGERLSEEDWAAIEEKFQSVYPRFTSTLLTLHNMSQVELQVCQLLKLNATPSEIANVLCKDKSSISTIRSRLYNKVFDKKGSGRDWDEFIRSL